MKRNLFSITGALAMALMVLMGCDNGTTNDDTQTAVPQSVTYVSADSNGNLYTLVITENTKRSARYTAKDGDSFTFKVELFNNGVYSVALTCSGTIESAENSGTKIAINVTVNGEALTITVSGTTMTVISGTIILDNEKEITINESLTQFIDKRALETAITAAYTAKAGVVVSANGADVPPTVYWVNQARMDTFTTAISTAEAVFNNEQADQSMVDLSKITIETATSVFNGQKQPGTKSGSGGSDTADVYVAGSYSNGTHSLPCYWKNGVKTNLPLATGEIRGWAEKIIVVGNDIYAMGNIDNGNRSIGCYWKNGTISLLSNDGYASDMVASNGNVYITGFYYRGDNYFPCYWRNGVRIDLPVQEGEYGNTSAISVYGDLVYTTGNYSMAGWGYSKICYWRNGVRTDLISTMPPIEGYTIYDIAVSDIGVAFIVGTTSWSYPKTPWYWSNGFNNLTVPTGSDSIPYGVALSGDNVYIAGFYDNGNINSRRTYACYWKNGSLNALSGGSTGKDSHANAVSVVGNDVFIAGAVDVFYDFDGGNSTSTACYWKNGSLSVLSSNASANGIFVVSR